VTQSIHVAILKQESLSQISAFMDFGLITKMVLTPPTVIPIVSSINHRLPSSYKLSTKIYLITDFLFS
jgi:hypothetical protein